MTMINIKAFSDSKANTKNDPFLHRLSWNIISFVFSVQDPELQNAVRRAL